MGLATFYHRFLLWSVIRTIIQTYYPQLPTLTKTRLAVYCVVDELLLG